MNDKYDELIKAEVNDHFPELMRDFGTDGWKWVKALVWQESEFNPNAVSHCGAMGLMQLMPGTDKAIDGDIDGKDPAGNVDNGVKYLAEQYRHFPEIPKPTERLKFALAAYNGGRGYINRALVLAKLAGGQWPEWLVTAPYLADPRCVVRGKRPDYKQILDYVTKIVKKRAML